jgi:3-oxoacyl-ACP reductase-like protein
MQSSADMGLIKPSNWDWQGHDGDQVQDRVKLIRYMTLPKLLSHPKTTSSARSNTMSRTAMGLFPPTPKYTFENIPNFTGKVAIVTGANTGIGKVTARELLKNGAKVYIACRNEEKANKAMDDLKAATGKTDVQYVLD